MYEGAGYRRANAYAGNAYASNSYAGGGQTYATQSLYETQGAYGSNVRNYNHATPQAFQEDSSMKFFDADANTVLPEYPFDPRAFLDPSAPPQMWVSSLGEVQTLIHETWARMMHTPLPPDITITIGSAEVLAPHFGGMLPAGVRGFAIPAKEGTLKQIFIKSGPKDQIMMTIGHELGHISSPILPDIRDEEAKAYAFSLAWMQVMREHRIGDLKPQIWLSGAKNGIHNVALDAVLDASRHVQPLTMYHQLTAGLVTHETLIRASEV